MTFILKMTMNVAQLQTCFPATTETEIKMCTVLHGTKIHTPKLETKLAKSGRSTKDAGKLDHNQETRFSEENQWEMDYFLLTITQPNILPTHSFLNRRMRPIVIFPQSEFFLKSCVRLQQVFLLCHAFDASFQSLSASCTIHTGCLWEKRPVKTWKSV